MKYARNGIWRENEHLWRYSYFIPWFIFSGSRTLTLFPVSWILKMKLLFSLILALLKWVLIDSTISIGYINAAAYIPWSLTNVTVVNGTCNQCICYAFFSNRSTSYQALNCYSNNNTCLLFTGLPSLSQLQLRTQSAYSFLRSTSYSTEGNWRSPWLSGFG